MPHESVKQGSTVVQSVIFVKPFLLLLKLLEIIKVLVKMVLRLLPCRVYLKINLSQNVIMGNMGSPASFEVSCGFVSQKKCVGTFESSKSRNLRFFFKSEKLFVRKQKTFVFPLRDSVGKLN